MILAFTLLPNNNPFYDFEYLCFYVEIAKHFYYSLCVGILAVSIYFDSICIIICVIIMEKGSKYVVISTSTKSDLQQLSCL